MSLLETFFAYFVVILVISALVFFHELGHFLMARFFNVKIEKFSIGFSIFGLLKPIAEIKTKTTNYTIYPSLIFGGYVKMKGQDDSDPTKKSYDSDSYNVKTPAQKIFILLAGPLANFVLAFVLYFVIALGGPNILSPVIGTVVKESPAFVAGLETNDTIRSINGAAITTWKEMAEVIETSEGSLNMEIERAGYIHFITLSPKITQSTNMFNEVIEKKMIGIAAAGVSHRLELSIGETLSYATEQTVFASTLIFTGLKKLVSGDVPAKEVGGAISIIQMIYNSINDGWMSVLFFAALISVNLGVLNLLPIPALDGGHIMFNLYELIFRREVNEEIMVKLTIAGWVILFSLMGLGLYNDINRLIG